MNSVSEQIDERILRLLGLDDVFDLDYDTYLTLLKEVIVAGSDKLPQEELALLANERKRIRGKKGRFKPKKEKITADKIATTRFLKPTNKNLVLPESISKPDTSQNLIGFSKPLESIAKTLSAILKFNKKTNEEERKDKESEKRTKREESLEGFKKGVSAISGAARKLLAPFQSIIDRIWRFIFFTLLGRAFTQLMEWLGDPKNKRKIEVLGRFLKDWWPTLAFAAGLFLTPFGKFVRTTIGLVRAFIPQLIKLTTNPAFLAIAGATAGGIAGASLESNIRKVDEKLLQRRIKEAEDKGKPLSKQEIEKIKLDQLQKRIQDIRGTNLPGNALLASGGVIPRFAMGGMNTKLFDTGYEGIDGSTGQRVSGFGPDTQQIIAQPGEIVMNKKTVDAMGPGYFLGLNRQYGGPGANKPKMGKMFNTGGMVGRKPTEEELAQQAYASTVRIEGQGPPGSGVLVKNDNGLYTILTAAHTIRDSLLGEEINIITSDGKRHIIKRDENNYRDLLGEGIDLGQLRFKSNENYPVVSPGDVNKLTDKDNIFVGGYPIESGTWKFLKGKKIPGSRGDTAYPEGGYTMGYDMPTSVGMSGGPVFNSSGELVGIHGREISDDLSTKQKEWGKAAIPISTYLDRGGTFGNISKKGGGLIKENTGMNIPGATADRQLAALQPGEYVLPAGTVSKLGVPLIDQIVAMTDYDSTPAKLGKKPINRSTITPLPRSGMGGMMTLPPITQSAGGSMGFGSAAGSRVPSFSTISPSSGGERSMNASIYGIVG